MRSTPQKHEEVINGITLWSQSSGRMVFARQLQPTPGLYRDDRATGMKELLTPVLVGYDGEYGRDLISLLLENEHLKAKLESLEAQASTRLSIRIDELDQRMNRFSWKPWYMRIWGGL